MIGLIFTLDYEIYGTGVGDFSSLMIDPTNVLLDMCDKYGAKITIMAEVAEIMALKKNGSFSTTVDAIEKQLKRAIKGGHDVQLHLHPGWFNSTFDGKQWRLDFDEYALVGLSQEKIGGYIRQGKEYLENLLRPVNPEYQCIAYRAGNWLMQPSDKIIAALEEHGIKYDTSVFKGGHSAAGHYEIDYRNACSDIHPWQVKPTDINQRADRTGLIEVPILCKEVFVSSMITLKRLILQYKVRTNSKLDEPVKSDSQLGSGKSEVKKKFFFSKKFDFCRLTFREMKTFTEYAEEQSQSVGGMLPVVAIGHSTEYGLDNALEKFCRHVKEKGEKKVCWTTFLEMFHADYACE